MEYAIAPVKNITKLGELGLSLKEPGLNGRGIGVCYGETGLGKTTGLTWYGVKTNAVYVRALQVWTPSAMLTSIAHELGIVLPRDLAKAVHLIVQHLSQQNRTLMIDEADYVVEKRKLLNTLRDLHDLAATPLILVGMRDFVRKLKAATDQRQFTGRVAFELEFEKLDADDTALLAKTLLPALKLDHELQAKLHEVCDGSARLVSVGLQRIEKFAKERGLKIVTAKEWGKRPLNLMAVGETKTQIASNTLAA